MAAIKRVFPCSAVFRTPCSEIQNRTYAEHRNTAFSATFPCSGVVFPNVFQKTFRNTAEKAVFRCSLYIAGCVPEHARHVSSAALKGLAA